MRSTRNMKDCNSNWGSIDSVILDNYPRWSSHELYGLQHLATGDYRTPSQFTQYDWNTYIKNSPTYS